MFGGMGPYTVNEVFLLAGKMSMLFDRDYYLRCAIGLSPFLTEQEIFKCPSRVARLCEGFWSFAHNAHITLPYVPFNPTLAHYTDSQRYKYIAKYSRGVTMASC